MNNLRNEHPDFTDPNHRWLEAEKVLFKSGTSQWVYKYARDIVEAPIPEVEKILVKRGDASHLLGYLQYVKKDYQPNKWLEKVLLKNKNITLILRYKRENLRGAEWPEADQVALGKSVLEIIQYAADTKVKKGSWPEAEKIFLEQASKPGAAVMDYYLENYILRVRKSPWPEAEKHLVEEGYTTDYLKKFPERTEEIKRLRREQEKAHE